MGKVKTIIADDDHLVRSYLKMLSSWERAGFEIAADVRDGEEALEVLKRTKAELLVTDLAMPLMDGIELIREIRKINQELYIIVLSCHDEFEYVKDAMKAGADEYILKNMLDENTLYELLTGTKNKIEERGLSNAAPGQSTVYTNQGDVSAKYRFFNGVLAGSLKGEARENARIYAGIRGVYQNSAVISLFLEEWEETEERWNYLEMEQYCQDFLVRLQDGIAAMLDADIRYMEVIYLGKGVFCGFLDLSDLRRSSQMYQKLTSAASACYKICREEQYRYRIGVSNLCIGSESIRQAYQQAREMMKLSFYDDREILYYGADRKSGTQIPPKASALLNSAEKFVYQNDREGFLRGCRDAREEFEQELTESRLVFQWLWQLERKLGIVREREAEKLYHIQQLAARLEEDAEKIFEIHTDAIPQGVNKAVRIAAEFAVKHYKEPVGLTEAAQAAGVNSAYLSYLFQKEMKIGFSNFLLNRRIECAQEMLKKTNLKVREVAEQSGFNDYHYFSKVFKKMNGVSPAGYRKCSRQNSGLEI